MNIIAVIELSVIGENRVLKSHGSDKHTNGGHSAFTATTTGKSPKYFCCHEEEKKQT